MTQHYFSESPDGAFVPKTIEVDLGGAPRSVMTAGGVFSPEQLDRGTRVLLDALAADPPPSAVDSGGETILDIGCGWGPIALSAALESPAHAVWAIDVNERSRELTAENAARLGLSNITVCAPDDVPAATRFTQIRSNPPIRVGKSALHGILETWLPRLQPAGSASLVVAKHLGAESLARWIGERFDRLTVERAARAKGFHVIRAVADHDRG